MKHPPADHHATPPPLSPHGTATTSPQRGSWRVAPVFWAAFGTACLLFQLWVFTRWAIDGNAHALPPGTAQITTARKITTRVVEAAVLTGIAVMALVCCLQSRAAHRVTLSAALMTGYTLTFWTSPYNSAIHHAAGHNRYDLNVLTWGPYLPGWHGPMPQIETFLMAGGYPWVILWIWAGLGIAAWLRRRRPGWSRPRIIAATAIGSALFDFAFEYGYIWLGGYAYPLALPHLTFFEGQWHQLPVTSAVCMVAFAVLPVVAMTLYAGNREVWLLEGSLDLPRRAQPWVRLLAGVGYANAGMLALQLVTLATSLISTPVTEPGWIYQPPASI